MEFFPFNMDKAAAIPILHITQDNGIVPESSFLLDTADGVGLQTVKMLISQLGGSISSTSDQGLGYKMLLNTDGYRERI
jgi:two-component sensor histidine kinase